MLSLSEKCCSKLLLYKLAKFKLYLNVVVLLDYFVWNLLLAVHVWLNQGSKKIKPFLNGWKNKHSCYMQNMCRIYNCYAIKLNVLIYSKIVHFLCHDQMQSSSLNHSLQWPENPDIYRRSTQKESNISVQWHLNYGGFILQTHTEAAVYFGSPPDLSSTLIKAFPFLTSLGTTFF